jgi:hypothetical protein
MLITPSTIPALAGDVQQLGWITELALRQRAIDQRYWDRSRLGQARGQREKPTDHTAVAFKADIGRASDPASVNNAARADSACPDSLCAVWDQPHNPEVTGSNPVPATTKHLVMARLLEPQPGLDHFR